jgi:GNAT superfamily N-acetyltransferase
VDDAPALGVVHVRSWQATYAGLVPQSYLDEMDPVARGHRWAGILANVQPPAGTTVLESEADAVIGFASVMASEDPDATLTTGRLAAIYLDPDHWGRGGGRLLMADAVDRLTAAGFTTATLWVLNGNARARRFYEAAGWLPDGVTQLDDSFGFPLDEVRYHRPL